MIMFRSQSETTLGIMIPQFPVKTAPVFLGIGEFHTALLILNQVLCVTSNSLHTAIHPDVLFLQSHCGDGNRVSDQ